MKKLFIIVLLSIAMMCGCAMQAYKFPECNNQYAQESLLAKIANDHGVCLQDVGNGIMTVSMLKFCVKPDIVKDALSAAEKINDDLNYDITDIAFKELVEDQFKAAILADLIEINAPYLSYFNTGNAVDKESRLIIQSFLTGTFIPRLKTYAQQIK